MTENSNKYLTVQALTKYLKRKFDVDPYLQKVFVVGEISNYRKRPNAHQYFSLKDDKARISAVIYKREFQKIPFDLEEGMKVFAVGRISLYEPNGSYQITIESIEPDGIGALYQALEQLKKKLNEAGLFDLPKKRIPVFPRKIAVITSPTGAVIRDILTTIQRRFPIVGVTVFPTRVQGKEAAGEIVRAFGQIKDHEEEFDTVILARGGGSIEDLWPFNEEIVAHAILNCNLPVISSIGHETDTTIADLVADQRAATPTAAAEIAVPVLAEVLTYLKQQENRLHLSMTRKLQLLRKQLDRYRQSYVMMQPERLYQAYLQELDILNQKLSIQQDNYLEEKNLELATLKKRLRVQSPETTIKRYQKDLDRLREQLMRQIQIYLLNQNKLLANKGQLLDAYSPLKSMQRGYAVVMTKGKIVKSIKEVKEKENILINLSDGQIQASVEEISDKTIFD